ncbi:MAG TPA: helix-turn-helix domain-containing protein, partial [Ktedonobacteraceae bacterium]
MSVRQYSVACDLEDERLNATDKSVLLILANHADENGGRCFPSVPTIAKKAWTSERSVQRSLKALEECAYLVVERGRGRDVSQYHLTLPDSLL